MAIQQRARQLSSEQWSLSCHALQHRHLHRSTQQVGETSQTFQHSGAQHNALSDPGSCISERAILWELGAHVSPLAEARCRACGAPAASVGTPPDSLQSCLAWLRVHDSCQCNSSCSKPLIQEMGRNVAYVDPDAHISSHCAGSRAVQEQHVQVPACTMFSIVVCSPVERSSRALTLFRMRASSDGKLAVSACAQQSFHHMPARQQTFSLDSLACHEVKCAARHHMSRDTPVI